MANFEANEFVEEYMEKRRTNETSVDEILRMYRKDLTAAVNEKLEMLRMMKEADVGEYAMHLVAFSGLKLPYGVYQSWLLSAEENDSKKRVLENVLRQLDNGGTKKDPTTKLYESLSFFYPRDQVEDEFWKIVRNRELSKYPNGKRVIPSALKSVTTSIFRSLDF